MGAYYRGERIDLNIPAFPLVVYCRITAGDTIVNPSATYEQILAAYSIQKPVVLRANTGVGADNLEFEITRHSSDDEIFTFVRRENGIDYTITVNSEDEWTYSHTEPQTTAMEIYTIYASDWNDYDEREPFVAYVGKTPQYEIGQHTNVELINNDPQKFAKYGIVIGTITAQGVIRFWAVKKPTETVTLTVVFSETDGQGAIKNPSGYVSEGGGGGGINYSTDEQDTGLKWIDGKPIYRTTIISTFEKDGYYIIEQGFVANKSVETVVNIEGALKTNSSWVKAPSMFDWSARIMIYVNLNSDITTNIYFNNSGPYTVYTSVYYTKTTD